MTQTSNSSSARLNGTGIGGGVGIGRVHVIGDTFTAPAETASTLTAEEETSRLQRALDEVKAGLIATGEQVGGEAQDILLATVEIAEDPEIFDQAVTAIRGGATAEYAIWQSFNGFIEMIKPLGGYFAERVSDLNDLAQRVVRKLTGQDTEQLSFSADDPIIVIAKDLAPADTASYSRETVAGMVTVEGGPTSHTAILAGLKGIPALVGAVDAFSAQHGAIAIIDAGAGTLTVSPTEAELEAAREQIRLREERAKDTSPGKLKDGTPVPLLANIGSAADNETALSLGAEGVGLFRTEFLFLDSQELPSTELQYEEYRKVLAAFPGKKVVVRLLDAGADKPLAFLPEQHEENPALGLRGIRMLRAFEDVLDSQLSALARADAETESDLWVMAPMIADLADTEYFTAKARAHGLKTVGVMAEIPSSAVMADQIARDADFISIGTNDLTQYTLAADRMLRTVDGYHDSGHPAVLRLIKMICDGAAAHGKPVSVCGEAAGDPKLAVILVGLGVSSLSMSAHSIADVRAALAEVTLTEAQEIAAAALA